VVWTGSNSALEAADVVDLSHCQGFVTTRVRACCFRGFADRQRTYRNPTRKRGIQRPSLTRRVGMKATNSIGAKGGGYQKRTGRAKMSFRIPVFNPTKTENPQTRLKWTLGICKCTGCAKTVHLSDDPPLWCNACILSIACILT